MTRESGEVHTAAEARGCEGGEGGGGVAVGRSVVDAVAGGPGGVARRAGWSVARRAGLEHLRQLPELAVSSSSEPTRCDGEAEALGLLDPLPPEYGGVPKVGSTTSPCLALRAP